MPKVNLAATGHGSKSEVYADGSTIDYLVFPESTAIEKKRVANVQAAVKIVNGLVGRIDLKEPCNRYFKRLPKSRSLNGLWSDNTIFLDFSPSVAIGFFGATHSNDKDIALSAWCLDNKNRWVIAATIVHEFAHVAGAPGGASHDAEKAVDRCYFDPQYDPHIMGSIDGLAAYFQRMV